MIYNRCGRSGLKLPRSALACGTTSATTRRIATKQAICRTAFDHGITHFDLANNYGPPPGSRRGSLRRDPAPISGRTGTS
jgi:L-glyceraldehyde 3-phosphate reductase